MKQVIIFSNIENVFGGCRSDELGTKCGEGCFVSWYTPPYNLYSPEYQLTHVDQLAIWMSDLLRSVGVSPCSIVYN